MRTREDVLADLMAEVLEDPGTLDPATRRAAARNTPAAEGPEAGTTGGAPTVSGKAVRELAEKIHGGAWRVTDEDIAAVRKAGLSEDQVFEAVVASSLGAAKKRFDVAMAALAAAGSAGKSAVGGSR